MTATHRDTALSSWVAPDTLALLTDLYQLTMLEAYYAEGLTRPAVFDLFIRRMPKRNVLIAAGLSEALAALEALRFTPGALTALRALGKFSDAFLRRLAEFRFTGDVYAVPEGTPIFPDEPLLEIVAPLPEAQLIETFLLNQIGVSTMAASKARRVVEAAAGRPVVDFGLRRMHGADAGLKAARAFYVAGVAATSNVLAGCVYGIPVAGTMAHSYILAHEDEAEAFAAFAREFPRTTLLVDTYDTLVGVEKVIALAAQLGPEFRVRAIRLDSGELAELARAARLRLDAAGLTSVRIVASNSLDETAIAALVAANVPIDAFGVGTLMGTSADYPHLDAVYKLVAYDGAPRIKLAPEKRTLPGRKQVYRVHRGKAAIRDVIARYDERGVPGEPLLVPVMRRGKVLRAGRVPLAKARAHCQAELAQLPERVRTLAPLSVPYPVQRSRGLQRLSERVAAGVS